MKIGVVGLGHVGLVTALVLADQGNMILGIDKDKKKIDMLSKGRPTLYEPGIEDLLNKNIKRFRLSISCELLSDAEVIFIIVPTPTINKSIDLTYINEALEEVSRFNKKAIIVVKSTVVPGTAKLLSERFGIKIVSNPEFTREGTAIEDTKHPDRIVIGGTDKNTLDMVESVWAFTGVPVIKTNNENAELIKYASNAFLATKISFINEIANLCEKLPGCDVDVVAEGMGLDHRIAAYFLKAGLGWGGSCFPKDTIAIVSFARDHKEKLSIIEAAIKVNQERIERTMELAKRHLGGKLKGRRIGILGISFKNDTDDVRGSQSVKLIERLVKEGAEVSVYDPVAKLETYEKQGLYKSQEECIKRSDLIIIATEWRDFSDIDKIAKGKKIIDTRRVINSVSNDIVPIGIGRLDES